MPYPVLLICAEGGANRSAYWTAQMMVALRKKAGAAFDEHLFAISSVSGGSIGALTYSAARHQLSPEQSEKAIETFFEFDFLTGLTNRLIIAEPAHWFLPNYYPSCDRAVAFEEDLDKALDAAIFHSDLTKKRAPSFAECLQPVAKTDLYQPLHLINSTEVETGQCVVLSPADLSDDPYFQSNLLLPRLTKPIRLSTAMHLSARFPVFSPAAAITDHNGLTRHYVDGGYYDNGGYETARNVLKSIQSGEFGSCIRPVIFSIVNGYEEEERLINTRNMDRKSKPNRSRNYWDGVHFLNEPMEIMTAVSKIRSANTQRHFQDLIAEAKESYSDLNMSPGVVFDLKSNADLVPMNWQLSRGSKQVIDTKVALAIAQIDEKKIDLGLTPSVRQLLHKMPVPKTSIGTASPLPPLRIKMSVAALQTQTNRSAPKTIYGRMRKRNEAPPGMYWSVSQGKWMPKSEATYPIHPSKRKASKKK